MFSHMMCLLGPLPTVNFSWPWFHSQVKVDSGPIHLLQNPLAWVVHWVWHPYEPWLGSGSCSGGFGGDLWPSPPMWVGWYWGLSLGSGHEGSTDKGVEGHGVSSHSSAVPPAEKVVSFFGQGRITSQIFSDVKPDQVLLLVFLGCTTPWASLEEDTLWYIGGNPYPHPTLGFSWSWVQMEIPKGADELLVSRTWSWGLEEGGWCLPGGWGKGLKCLCEWLWLLEWECHLLDFDCLVHGPSQGHLAASAPEPWLKETGLIHSSILYFMGGPSRPGSALEANCGHMSGQFQVKLLYVFFLLPLVEHTESFYKLPQPSRSLHL